MNLNRPLNGVDAMVCVRPASKVKVASPCRVIPGNVPGRSLMSWFDSNRHQHSEDNQLT